MPSTVKHIPHKKNPGVSWYFYPHFTDGETETQRLAGLNIYGAMMWLMQITPRLANSQVHFHIRRFWMAPVVSSTLDLSEHRKSQHKKLLRDCF